jgi:hypothetical protein
MEVDSSDDHFFDSPALNFDSSDTLYEEYKYNYVQPFAEKISTAVCADPPTIHPDGAFGVALTDLISNFYASVFRGSLHPTPADVPLFNIEFSTAAPHLGYRPHVVYLLY